jgi:two-component system response regulator RegA
LPAPDPNPERPSILVVDDDEPFRERLARALRERSFDVRTAADVTGARAEALREAPELAVVDLNMPGGSGLDLVKDLRQIEPATRVVVLTGYGSVATAVEAIRLGAVHYLTKPADTDEILAAFDRAQPAVSTPRAFSTPSLARVEWEHIQRVLTDVGGNVSEAARRLGLHRRSLQRKLSRFPPRE